MRGCRPFGIGIWPGEIEIWPGEIEIWPGEIEIWPGEVRRCQCKTCMLWSISGAGRALAGECG